MRSHGKYVMGCVYHFDCKYNGLKSPVLPNHFDFVREKVETIKFKVNTNRKTKRRFLLFLFRDPHGGEIKNRYDDLTSCSVAIWLKIVADIIKIVADIM